MAFSQRTYRGSLCDIEACLKAQSNKLYNMDTRSKVARSTLAGAFSVMDRGHLSDCTPSDVVIDATKGKLA
ncbi:MAG: hypothetical protein BMS9Abin25_0792 [Gammaproteobacteria bacterium]|nr:MAG: hypothetical protein BMS9Abin25_0792 [Gammaproteobacteria bacterium]